MTINTDGSITSTTTTKPSTSTPLGAIDVTNGPDGTLTGGTGVYLNGKSDITLTNKGQIEGKDANGAAVEFAYTAPTAPTR